MLAVKVIISAALVLVAGTTGVELQTIIELIKVLLSWPGVFLAIIVLLSYRYRGTINEFICYITELEFAGFVVQRRGKGEVPEIDVTKLPDVANSGEIGGGGKDGEVRPLHWTLRDSARHQADNSGPGRLTHWSPQRTAPPAYG